MAPLKVRKPAAVMFDLVATATKSFFIDEILFPYIKKHTKQYLVDNWKNEVVQHDVSLMRKAAKKDDSGPKIAEPGEDTAKIQESVYKYVSYCLDEKKDNEGMTLFRFHIIFDGYSKNRLETPLYTDVAVQMHHWVVEDKVKLYIFSNGWKEATKRYLEKTSKGDMNLLITDHFDTEEGQLTDPATFKKIVAKIKQTPEDVLFLTHCAPEAMAAKKAGLGAILIMTHRRDVNKLTADEKKELPYVRSFNEIIFTGDAPKANNLDGSSVVDGDESGSGAVASTKNKMKSSVKSGKKKKKSSKAVKSSEGGSKTGSKSGSKTSYGAKSSGKSKAGSKSTKSSAAESAAGNGDGAAAGGSKTGSSDGKSSASGSKTGSSDGKSPAGGSKTGSSNKKSPSGGSKTGSSNKKSPAGGSKTGSSNKKSPAGGSKTTGSSDGKSPAGGSKTGSSDRKSSAGGSKSEGKQ